MQNWSKLTVESEERLTELIQRARQDIAHGAPAGIGVFRAREGLALYLSPIASEHVLPGRDDVLEPCARPDEMMVTIAVRADDDPAWYDRPEQEMEDEVNSRVIVSANTC